MNSFDVFDTLIARRYISSNSILDYIEKTFGIQNFKKERIASDTGHRSFNEIYEDLFIKSVITDRDLLNKIKQFEIDLEIQNCFCIKKNMELVNDGDLLISDMYLDAATILNMVRSAGLNKQVSIYQSNGDKGNGKIWKDLINNKPNLHIGDNIGSDYARPMEFGFNVKLTKESDLNECEKFLIQNNLQNIALLCREVRLKNDFKNYNNFFDIAVQLNLPFLFICCELIFRSHEKDCITFLGRDCQLLWRLYQNYYKSSFYLPFSREVAFKDPSTSIQYLLNNSSSDKSVFVDLSSGGNTWSFLNKFSKLNIKTIIYSDSNSPIFDLPDTFSYITKNSECGQTNLLLEVFNCGDHGRLKDLTKITDKVILTSYADKELPDEIIKAVQSPIIEASSISPIYAESIRQELSTKTKEELMTMFSAFSATICSQNAIKDLLSSFMKKEDDYFNQIKNLHFNAKKNY